jgi:hypothetical protein
MCSSLSYNNVPSAGGDHGGDSPSPDDRPNRRREVRTLKSTGSRNPNPELFDNFLGKKFYSSFKIGPNYFLQHFKNKIIFNFVKFVAKKMVWHFFFHPYLLLLFLDPGSEIRDPGWVKIRIRDKHPGSATLPLYLILLIFIYLKGLNP